MYIARKEDIYYIDKECKVPVEILMENAGKNSFLWIKNNIDNNKKLLVLCGAGNNGGDGAVLARYLIKDGIDTEVVFIGDVISKSKEVAKENFIKLKELTNVNQLEINYKNLETLKTYLEKADVIVDAIFGIGLNRELDNFYLDLFELINSSKKTIISLDIPSGVMANGENFKSGIKANYTLTFGLPKFGMINYPGATYCGKIEIIDIGIPKDFINSLNLPILIEKNMFKLSRERNTHKGTYGHLLIIGGYGGNFKEGIKAMSGSVILSALAAMKAGVGLTTIAADVRALPAIQSLIPEAMTFGWKEKPSSLKEIKKLIEKSFIRTILIGNGFHKGKIQKEILKLVLTHPIVTKIVIDADAINILSENKELLSTLYNSGKEIILTPHIGEASRLLSLSTEEIKSNKLEIVKKISEITNANVILKDSVSVIYGRNTTFINNRGSSSLARGGSGDILAGLIAGFLATGYEVLYSICLGSYILGICGEMCEEEMGAFSVLGRDILNKISSVIKEISMPE